MAAAWKVMVERRGRRPRRRGRSGQGQTAANYNVQGGLWIPCAVTCTWPGAASVGRRASSPSRTLRTCTDALSCARTTKEASELAIRALEGVVERDLVGGTYPRVRRQMRLLDEVLPARRASVRPMAKIATGRASFVPGRCARTKNGNGSCQKTPSTRSEK